MKIFKSVWIASVLGSLVIFLSAWATAGGPPTSVRYRDHYQMDALGNTQITRTMQFPPATYIEVKQKFADPLMLLRSFSSQMDWHEVKIIDSRFDDAQCQIVVEMEEKGLARTIAEGQWEIKSKAKPGTMELITCTDKRVIFHTASQSNWGPVSTTIALEMDKSFHEVAFDQRANAIRFAADPTDTNADATDTSSRADKGSDREMWRLEAAPRLMSSLAKVYSNEDFGMLWTGRSVFTNNHQSPVRQYQVRFRLEGYSSWSPWKKTPIVYPGQSVVEGFFPVLDIDALNGLEGSRRTNLLAEYRYEDENGEKFEETETQTVEILARNEVVFSRLGDNEAVNWAEANEFLPMVLASFCTGNDPVIQQLAGRICGMSNGPAASLDSEDAVRYLTAVWKFMEDNRIAYQTSPGLKMDQHFGQHIKYGRDLLRNRAGTCVDLAIFWASAAKAVGLKAYIMVIPGHAFPVIQLPNGSMIPIEATLLGKGHTLDDAYQKGSKELEEAMQGDYFQIDIDTLQDAGIRPLDLERANEDFLDNLKYTFKPLPAETE